MILAFLRAIPARLWGYVAIAGVGLLALLKLLGIIRKAGKADDLQRRLDTIHEVRKLEREAKEKTHDEILNDISRN